MRLAVALSVLVLALPAAADARVSFSGPNHFGAGDLPRDVVVGDFNGDADPDLAVSNHFSDDVSVLVGGAGGTFAAAPGSPFPGGRGPGTIRMGDINGDGDPDLAVVDLTSHHITILLGGPGASFTATPAVSTGSRPYDVALADFDGDGDTDRRALAPGRYAVRAVATSADGRRSAPAKVGFRVTARKVDGRTMPASRVAARSRAAA